MHATVHQYPAWEAGMENHTVSGVWGEMLRIKLAEIAEKQGARGLCTMCAIKKGVGA